MEDTNLISDQKYQRGIWGYIPLDIHPWMDQFNAEYFWFRTIQCSTQGKLNGGWRTEFHTKALHESKMKVGRIYFTIILNDGSKTQAVVQKIIHRVFLCLCQLRVQLGWDQQSKVPGAATLESHVHSHSIKLMQYQRCSQPT